MYNELLFLGHIIVVSGSILAGLAHSYGALLGVLGVQIILANVFVSKQIVLFGMTTTCSEVFIVGSMYGMSLIQTYYGTQRAQRAIVYMFSLILLFVLMSYLHLSYHSIGQDGVSDALQQVLSLGPRFLFAGLLAYVTSERINVLYGSYMQVSKVASFARIVGIMLGQLVDTIVYTYVALYGVLSNLESMALFSFVVKVLAIFALAPMLSIAQYYILPRSGCAESGA